MDLYSQIDSNKRKTWLIVIFFVFILTGLVYLFSYILGGEEYAFAFVPLAFIVSVFSSIGSYYFSDKIVLAVSGAKKAEGHEFQQLHNLVENLSIAAGVTKPQVYYIDDSAPNAFATGRDPKHAVICVTTGLLQKLERDELEGVIAHELGHVKNYDIRLMAIVAVLVGSIALIADWMLRSTFYGGRDRDRKSGGGILIFIAIFAAILTPIIAQLIKLALSRNREYLADSTGAYLTRYPKGLADALIKISQDREPLEAANKGTAHMYIVNPFKGELAKGFANMFSTHPPVEERIKRLMQM